MGLCHMFPYCNKPAGWLSTNEKATFVKAEINPQLGQIEYKTWFFLYNDVTSFDRMQRVQKTIELIKILAGILLSKESDVDTFKMSHRGTRDNPPKKLKQMYNTSTNKRAFSAWTLVRNVHYALTNLEQRCWCLHLMIKEKGTIPTHVGVPAIRFVLLRDICLFLFTTPICTHFSYLYINRYLFCFGLNLYFL